MLSRLAAMVLLTFVSLGSCYKKPVACHWCGAPIDPVLAPAAAWAMEPTVLVCSTAPVTKDEVQQALDLWADHGAPQLTAMDSYCLGNQVSGYVYVDLRHAGESWEPGVLATTYYSPYTPRDYAIIHLSNGDLRVLTHEVGHIWLGHASVSPHVLHPSIGHFDWDAWEDVEYAFALGGY